MEDQHGSVAGQSPCFQGTESESKRRNKDKVISPQVSFMQCIQPSLRGIYLLHLLIADKLTKKYSGVALLSMRSG